MTVSGRPCPCCKRPNGVITMGRTILACGNCGREWPNLPSYEVSVALLGVSGIEAMKSDGDGYIEDGGLENDLNDLARKSQVHILKLVLSQLPILDWNKSGLLTVEELKMYLERTINDIEDRRL